MSEIMLLVIDQLRYIMTLLAAELIFLIYAVPRRKNFAARMAVSYSICVAGALLYIPLFIWLSSFHKVLLMGSISAVYWMAMMVLTCFAQKSCFKIGFCNILFRCIAGSALESIGTVVLRSLIINMWAPALPQKHPLLYLLLASALYGLLFLGGYKFMAVPLQRSADVGVPEDRKTFHFFVLLYVGFALLIDVSKGISEWLLIPIDTTELHLLHQVIQYFSIAIMLLVSMVILLILYYVYEVSVLRTERQLLGHLMAEKAAQYERSRDNIEAINRKCHDLKHQILALKVADDRDRKAMIDEAEKAVMFYDAVVKTGNEVLDTLLTEKSTLCAYHNIRLSCTVNARFMGRIGVVDLYTMLGNAIDNAIECVQQFADEEKKTISLSIREKGRMLIISVENYYEKEIRMQGEYPLTSKADTQNHGIGIKSIATIARRYGGSAQVNTENQIFQLQILLPLPK